ncbi:MAG: hypothetical protein ABH873_08050 [Candidatus Firestonebacteria bacterium]
MKIEEPKAMAEIHEIRKNIYEETKNMTAREKLEWVHKESEKAKNKYGIRLSEMGKY